MTVTWQRFQAGPAVAEADAPVKKASYQGGYSGGSSGGFSLFGPSEEELRAERLERARAAADQRRVQVDKRRTVIKRYSARPQHQAAVE